MPKLLEKVYQTVDLQIFGTLREAQDHEDKVQSKTLFNRAYDKARRASNNRGEAHMNPSILFNCLIEEGMKFIIE